MEARLPLPSEQHDYPELPPLPERLLQERRERVFLVFAGLFLGTLAMLNIIGISRFVDLSFTIPLVGARVPMPVAIGRRGGGVASSGDQASGIAMASPSSISTTRSTVTLGSPPMR